MTDQKRGRGQPAHKPTQKSRMTVRVMRLDGRTHEEIATVLGISLPTLQKHYAEELATGDVTLRAEILQKLSALAKRGNIGAARLLMAQTSAAKEKNAAKAAEDEIMAEADAPKAKPLGKKEQAIENAKMAGVGTEWGDLLDPHAVPQGARPN